MYKLSSEIFVFWTGSVRLGRRFYLNVNSEFDLIGRIVMYKLSDEIFVFWTNEYLNTILFYSHQCPRIVCELILICPEREILTRIGISIKLVYTAKLQS